VTQLPNYIYRYTDPVTYSASLTAQF